MNQAAEIGIRIAKATAVRRLQEDSTARAPGSDTGIILTNVIPKTVSIRRTGAGHWNVAQQKVVGDRPPGKGRPYDYAQAPTWLRIENHGRPRAITVDLKWIEFGHKTYRKWGYLRCGRQQKEKHLDPRALRLRSSRERARQIRSSVCSR